MKRIALGFVVLLATAAAGNAADSSATSGSTQAIGLFRLACLDHAGDSSGLRAFLEDHGLHQMTADQAVPFVRTYPGAVYGATAKGIRLAVAAHDNVACSVFADQGDMADIDATLDSLLRRLAVPFIVVRDGPMPQHPAVHDRVYHVKLGGTIYSAVISTDETNVALKAIMTLAPRNPADAVPQDAQLMEAAKP